MQFMAQKFNLAGLKAESLSSKNSSERDRIREQFKKKRIQLFVCCRYFLRC
jgi:superfamily II DNA/RNA helicase